MAAHHERIDGHGYPHGLRGEQIPLGARIIAVADAFDELTHIRPDGAPLEPDVALELVCREAGNRFDPAVIAAFADVLNVPPRSMALLPKRQWPAGLSDREVEVMRVLATGASRRDMARQLVVTEHTIRHHLEHIYAKIDVRTRVEATLFALEHDLLA